MSPQNVQKWDESEHESTLRLLSAELTDATPTPGKRETAVPLTGASSQPLPVPRESQNLPAQNPPAQRQDSISQRAVRPPWLVLLSAPASSSLKVLLSTPGTRVETESGPGGNWAL